MDEIRGLQMLNMTEPQPEMVHCRYEESAGPTEGTCTGFGVTMCDFSVLRP